MGGGSSCMPASLTEVPMARSMVVSSLLLAMYAFGLAEDCNPTPPAGDPPAQTGPAAGQPEQNPTQPDPSTSVGQNAAGTDPGTAIGGALQSPPWMSVFDSGSLPDSTGMDTCTPWATVYWATYEDSINHDWDRDMPGLGGDARGGTLTDSTTSGSFFAPDGAGTGSPVSDGGVGTGKAWWEYKYEDDKDRWKIQYEELMRGFTAFMTQFEQHRDASRYLEQKDRDQKATDDRGNPYHQAEVEEELRLAREFWKDAQEDFQEAQRIRRAHQK